MPTSRGHSRRESERTASDGEVRAEGISSQPHEPHTDVRARARELNARIRSTLQRLAVATGAQLGEESSHTLMRQNGTGTGQAGSTAPVPLTGHLLSSFLKAPTRSTADGVDGPRAQMTQDVVGMITAHRQRGNATGVWNMVETPAPVQASEEESSVCAICLDDQTAHVGKLSSTKLTMPCSHSFHSACLLPWLLESNTCPVSLFRIYHLYTYHLYTYAQQMLALQYVNGSRGTYEHFMLHINESRHTLSRFAVL